MQVGRRKTVRKIDVAFLKSALYLSSNISLADYNMGYCLTGTLERGCKRTNQFQTTHFAVIRRCWPALENDNGKS
uniref:CSON004636 protein n=1 Tax=Culicoides sonorensis TaxID=179676 RepID=A0A336MPD4_CULSO